MLPVFLMEIITVVGVMGRIKTQGQNNVSGS
jgi:hypothetical protein